MPGEHAPAPLQLPPEAVDPGPGDGARLEHLVADGLVAAPDVRHLGRIRDVDLVDAGDRVHATDRRGHQHPAEIQR